MSIVGFLQNATECWFDRPVVARDHILRALSPDGVSFVRDETWRWRRPFTSRPHMNYFVTRDSTGMFWRRSSEYDGHTWRGVLFYGDRRFDAKACKVRDIIAPVWCDARLYAVIKACDGTTYIGVAEFSERGLTPFARLDWPGLEALGSVDDVFVLKTSADYWGWASCGISGRAIHAWTSPEGRQWSPCGVAVAPGPGETVANNPCVTPLGDGSYRMYYRASRNPAVGSAIVSAVSADLRNWTREPGTRLESGGRWDKHGVAFPAVFRDSDDWVLYYSGYWGDCAAGHRCAREWMSRGDAPAVIGTDA